MASRSAEDMRAQFEDLSKGKTFLAADDFTSTGVDFLAVRNSSYTIFVQSISVNVSTDNAATLTFKDDASTPVVIAQTKASPGLGLLEMFNGGAEGVPLTEGKNLDITASGAGLEGSLMVEAYQRLTAVIASNAGASSQ